MSSLTVTYTSAPEEAPLFPEQAPPSLEYVPGPEHPPSPDYVPGPEYLEYLVPFDDEEDPEEDPAKFPADGGDDNDEEEEDEEEEDHLASVDFTTLPAIDPVLLVEDTKAFETDESDPTPPSPPTHTCLTYVEAPLGYRAAIIWSRAASPPRALIAVVAAALPSSLPPPSPLTPLSSPLEDILEADVPPQKRLCLTALAPRFEVGESSAATAARQPGLDVTHATDYSFVDTVDATPRSPMSREVVYGITDVWDDMVGDMEGRAPITLEELSQRVTFLAITLAKDTHEIEARYTRQAWSQAMDCNRAVHAELLAYRAEGHDRTKEPEPARVLKPHNGPADAGSSC
ncbi:hypothetical protein Tco_0958337 [Tanacetum coccineum]